MKRDFWQRHTESLDPARDFEEIYRTLVTYEFPWDMTQALGFALFRTYAVPGIGRLLGATGEFTRTTQKRYDDTVLLLEPPITLGFEHPRSRAAIRRINQMHRAYDIPEHEYHYVLSTFVVVPKRWLDAYGYRPLSRTEVDATVHYYRTLGHHMGLRDLPTTYEEFEALLDSYEAEHFGFDEGGRAVADATLAMLADGVPRILGGVTSAIGRALMDPPLLAAFAYDAPPAAVVRLVHGALRSRGRLLRFFPARRVPQLVENAEIKTYPDGYEIDALGSFPVPGVGGCPVRHTGSTPT